MASVTVTLPAATNVDAAFISWDTTISVLPAVLALGHYLSVDGQTDIYMSELFLVRFAGSQRIWTN